MVLKALYSCADNKTVQSLWVAAKQNDQVSADEQHDQRMDQVDEICPIGTPGA